MFFSKAESCKLQSMVDIDLLVAALRDKGHTVENVIHVPENAGEYEMLVDGNLFNLEQARAFLEADETK
jgi:hypothetical protein